MNQLPITLYYPTAAQFEAYLGFMAMLSIGFGILRLVNGYRNKGEPSFILEMILLFNPISLISILFIDNRMRNGIDDWVALLLLFVTPLLLFIPFLL